MSEPESKPDRKPERVYEYVGNIHMHTTYSDGEATFDELVHAAAYSGLDYVFVTDHNVLVRKDEEGFRNGVLTLVGQEVHDPERDPAGNHLLCLGVEEDVTHLGQEPQELIDGVVEQGALAFLAHPIEEYTELFTDHYDWYDWDVKGYHGVELWNYMSRFRSYATSKKMALLMGYLPHWFTNGPLPEMLKKWDELTAERPVVAIGGSDVHGKSFSLGPLRRTFLPYEHCTQALNTHILTRTPFQTRNLGRLGWENPEVGHDRRLVLESLGAGRCWLGYDLLDSSTGFRFWLESKGRITWMGEEFTLESSGDSVSLHVKTPKRATIRLIHNGTLAQETTGTDATFAIQGPGVYRVEAHRRRWGRERGWIYSNPIYVRPPA